MIVGGGTTGVETTAEYAVEYPDKEITIIHSAQHLLTNEMSQRSQQSLQSQLRSKFKMNLKLGK